MRIANVVVTDVAEDPAEKDEVRRDDPHGGIRHRGVTRDDLDVEQTRRSRHVPRLLLRVGSSSMRRR